MIWPWLAAVSFCSVFYRKDRRGFNGATSGNCFIITSVVYPTNKSLSYSATRSVFTPEQRAEQTVKTISSIKSQDSAAKIILVEGGQQKNLPLNLNNLVDRYIFLGDNFFVKKACQSKLKSLGEAVLLLAAKKYLSADFSFYFKISGRYFLNDDFNLGRWVDHKFVFRLIKDGYVSTKLCALSGEMRRIWFDALLKGLPLLLLDYPIEFILYKYLPKKYFYFIDVLGVTGQDATNGQLLSE